MNNTRITEEAYIVKSLVKLYHYLKPYKVYVVMAPLLMLFEVAFSLIQPAMMQRIIDVGIQQLDLSYVISNGLLMIFFSFLSTICAIGVLIFASKATFNFGADLRKALYKNIQAFSFHNIDKLSTGHLITCMTNDIHQIQTLTTMVLRVLIRSPFTFIGSIVMAYITCGPLAKLLIFIIPILILIIVVVIKMVIPLYRKIQSKIDDLNNLVRESISAIKVVKSFVRSDHEAERFNKSNSELMNFSVRASKMMATVMPLIMLIINLGVVAVLWYGSHSVVLGQLKVGQIMAFINYLLQILFSLMIASMALFHSSRAFASADRIVEVLETQSEIEDLPCPDEFDHTTFVADDIIFDHVSFSYDDDNLALQDISFKIKKGQTVAILGQTGSGKSTLVHLLPRFYDIKSGNIYIGGYDIKKIPLKTLRQHIGIVQQDTFLFAGSIAYNLKFGNPDATINTIQSATSIAQAEEFIQEFEDTYDYQIEQGGNNLSGGQKQRISIARTLVMEPPILIMDDSTSAVDYITETKLQQALTTYASNKTCLIITQRVSAAMTADKIIILDQGRISAEGSHDSLLKNNLAYQEIYHSQNDSGGDVHV